MTGKRPQNRQFPSRRALKALLWLCWLPVCHAEPPGTGGAAIQPAYRLDSLALAIRQEQVSVRADLAAIALDELATAYAREALHAREDIRQHSADRDLRRWADAVDRLAAQLAGLAATVTSTTPVHVGISPEHSLYLVVSGEPVVVNGPRTAQQAALEHRIIQRFCSLNACERLLAETPRAEAVKAETAANPHWSFGEAAGPVCSSGDGLDFAFGDSNNLLQKRGSCTRAITELYALADAIAHHASSGARIEWDALAIHESPGENTHAVEINSDGTTVNLQLPLLAATPQLLPLARPWLAARFAGRQQRVLIEDADQLFRFNPAP